MGLVVGFRAHLFMIVALPAARLLRLRLTQMRLPSMRQGIHLNHVLAGMSIIARSGG